MAHEHDDIVQGERELSRAMEEATKQAEEQEGPDEEAAILLLFLLRSILSRGYVATRQRARRTLERQLEGLAVDEVRDLADVARAHRYAQRSSARWLRKTRELRGDGASRKGARRGARKATRGYRNLVSSSEVSRTYNQEREELARQHARRTGDDVWLVWDASLDRRTCPTCVDKDGTKVLASEGWGGLGPGSVHPGCRCTSTVTSQSSRLAA